MADLFEDKADDWDDRPIPAQISTGVVGALRETLTFEPDWTVMDFGAGTGLLCGAIAPAVDKILAVDISKAMLDRLVAKPELAGKVEAFCQNILDEPLDQKVDLVVSAMAMHHVEDTAALMKTLFEHLEPGGRIALADLDREEGDFHPAGMEGVFHHGFDRVALGETIARAGFGETHFVTATEVHKDGKVYPVFLVTARKPA